MIAHHLPELLNLLCISSEGPGLPDLLESLRQWQSVEGTAAPGEHERRITITFEKMMKDITLISYQTKLIHLKCLIITLELRLCYLEATHIYEVEL